MEAAESSSWYRNEGNGWNLRLTGSGETCAKGCLCKSGTLIDTFLNGLSKLGLIFIHLRV